MDGDPPDTRACYEPVGHDGPHRFGCYRMGLSWPPCCSTSCRLPAYHDGPCIVQVPAWVAHWYRTHGWSDDSVMELLALIERTGYGAYVPWDTHIALLPGGGYQLSLLPEQLPTPDPVVAGTASCDCATQSSPRGSSGQ
jgi:hypothetical protein